MAVCAGGMAGDFMHRSFKMTGGAPLMNIAVGEPVLGVKKQSACQDSGGYQEFFQWTDPFR